MGASKEVSGDNEKFVLNFPMLHLEKKMTRGTEVLLMCKDGKKVKVILTGKE